MSARRPGIIIRLSNLIILQVLFIFVALALILFNPGSDQLDNSGVVELEHALHLAGQTAQDWLNADGNELPGGSSRLNALLVGLPKVDCAAVIRLIDRDRIDVLYAYQRPAASEFAAEAAGDVSGFCDYDVLRHLAGGGSLPECWPTIGADYLADYHRLETLDEAPTVLVVGAEHGMTVSSRSGLQYAVLILFLCATLVSLLTVSLLRGKFKRPLDRIISCLEKTAEGELCELEGLDGDPHLGRLAGAYNDMARRLWDSRRELAAYNTELEEANRSLRESQAFLSTLIDSTPLSVVVANPAGEIILFNRAATEVFGYGADEAAGRPVEMLVADGAEQPAQVIENGRSREFEIICRRQDGEQFPVYVIAANIKTEQAGLVARLYVCRDITDSKNFQDMMIRLDRYYTKGEMAGDIAHEVNNYLAVLMGNVELLPLMLKKGKTEKIEKKLGVMKSMLDKIACISDGLLDAPPETVRLEPTSLNQVVENVLAFLKPQNKFDTVEVITELSNEIPVLKLDQMQTQQLLVNLIYNAAEALADQEGERSIRVQTRLAVCEDRRCAEVLVRDNGPGIAAEKTNLLFEDRFTTKKRGHGIGLITCRKIVDNHEGQIKYHFDEGAVFTVILPARPVAPEDIPPQLNLVSAPR